MNAPALPPAATALALAELACEAGREIYRIWVAGFDTETKLDGSPVTIADQRAEAIILAGLARLAPRLPVLAEEEAAEGRIPELGDLCFVVDPLDGTRGFSESRSQGEFTVNIALMRQGVPVRGVIYAPASGELFGGDEYGAWRARCLPETAARVGGVQPIAVAALSAAPRLVMSRSTGIGARLDAFARHTGAGARVSGSSSLKFCRVAEGAADIYPRFGPLCDWDIAAGHAILRAAGGDVIALDGAPIRYGDADAKFLHQGLIAFGDAGAERLSRAALEATA